MTIKLLTPRGQYPVNAIVTFDAATEAALVADKVATTNLTGGTAYVAPAAGNTPQVVSNVSYAGGKLFDGNGNEITSLVSGGGKSGQQITKPSKNLFNFGSQANAVGPTNITESFVTTPTGFSSYTRAWAITNDAASIAKGSLALDLDPDDLLLQFDIYLPFLPVTGQRIDITITNQTTFDSTRCTIFSFDVGYLKMGWNSLRCWAGDTAGASGTGTLSEGVSKMINGSNNGGVGCNMAASIGRFDINFINMSGKTVYADSLRRGCKMKPSLVMTWDATGTGTADNVMTETVAPMLKQYGMAAGFTVTYIYDLIFAQNADYQRKVSLYNDFGWDAMNHLYNHGVTKPGATATVTANRAGSTVTLTYGVAHGFTVGEKYYAGVTGELTLGGINGVYEMTPTTTTAITYQSAGTAGAGTGTIQVSTIVEKVIVDNSATSKALLRHELADLNKSIKSQGWTRGAHIGAWPNNSVGDIDCTAAICAEAGIRLFRGKRGGGAVISEAFGVVNPFHIGSFEMGSGAGATTLQQAKDKLDGCIGRGESFWTYGHFPLNELAQPQYAPVTLGSPPGSDGNPNPPGASLQGGIGGYWYTESQLRPFVAYAAEKVAAGQLLVQSPSQWTTFFGV